MNVYVYRDGQGWHQKLSNSLNLMGVHTQLFLTEQAVENMDEHSVVFIHMTHYGLDLREQNKQLVEKVAERDDLFLIPTIGECRLYDDKILQYQTFGERMPKTWHITNFDDAIENVKQIKFPFISKSSKGAGSSNIRFLKTRKQALEEIDTVFKREGITCWLKDKQKDYLLWQEFIPNNLNDWRVILIAKKYAMILKRYNRPDIPFASGSGDIEPVQNLDSCKQHMILAYTREFANAFNFSFLGVDIIFDGRDNQPLILETTTGWSFEGYLDCPVFEFSNGEWNPTEYNGKTMFDLVAKLIVTKEFEE